MKDVITVRIVLDEKERYFYHADRKLLLDFLEKGIITSDQYSELFSETVELERMDMPISSRLYKNFMQKVKLLARHRKFLQPRKPFDEEDYSLVEISLIEHSDGSCKRLAEFPKDYRLTQIVSGNGALYLQFDDPDYKNSAVAHYRKRL